MAINTAHEGGGYRPSARQPKPRGNPRGGRLNRSNSERSGRGRFSNRNEIYRTKSDDLYTRLIFYFKFNIKVDKHIEEEVGVEDVDVITVVDGVEVAEVDIEAAITIFQEDTEMIILIMNKILIHLLLLVPMVASLITFQVFNF